MTGTLLAAIARLLSGASVRWIDCQPDFDTSHYINGFAWPVGKFRFKADWSAVRLRQWRASGPVAAMPSLPDHWEVIEEPN